MKKILLLLAMAITFVGADALKVSSDVSTLNRYAYESPHGKALKISNLTKTIIVSFEKDTGKLVNEYLNNKYPPYMFKHNAVFIADINEMPSIITKLFALPKMRKYKHTIYLHNTEEFAKFVPSKEEKITVIKLQNGKVKSISFISTEAELKSALEN